jgi:hypothetical protein
VAFHPELIVPNDPFPNARGAIGAHPDDTVNHPHMPGLREKLVNLFLAANCRGEVDIVDKYKEFGSHFVC